MSNRFDEFVIIEKEDAEYLVTRYGMEDRAREEAIKASRDVLKLSKSSIYKMQRGDIGGAGRSIEEAKTKYLQTMQPIFKDHPFHRYTSFTVGCLEEWAEAMIFYSYMTNKKLISYTSMKDIVSEYEYLGGLCDTAGELVRHATRRATERDIVEVKHVAAVINEIDGMMCQIDLRNSPLRVKYDSLKYRIKSVEQLIYELTIYGQAAVGGDKEPQPSSRRADQISDQ